jgi:hypothetical protein
MTRTSRFAFTTTVTTKPTLSADGSNPFVQQTVDSLKEWHLDVAGMSRLGAVLGLRRRCGILALS